MTDNDNDLLKRLLDDEVLTITTVKEVGERFKELVAENSALADLLARNIDDDPCRRDHHGYCQTHYLEEDCSVDAARKFLEGR